MIIIFIGILNMEGTLSASVDGLTGKFAKTVVSNAVPVVGKLISDATDSVIGSISVTQNAVGIIGILVIAVIAIVPIIKSFIFMIMFRYFRYQCST